MSWKFYGKLWIATATDLKNVILKEKVMQQMRSTQDQTVAHRLIASLYARYVILVNNLGDIFDQTLQVQKRQVVQNLLVAAVNRLLELRKELTNIEMSEFIYIDQTLIEQKYVPQDIELMCPFFFPQERAPEIQDLIDRDPNEETPQAPEVLSPDNNDVAKPKWEMLAALKKSPPPVEESALAKAVNLIKAHHRARRARIRLFNIHHQPELYKPKPPIVVSHAPYSFYHKDDQPMLFRILRSNYQIDFYKSSYISPAQLSQSNDSKNISQMDCHESDNESLRIAKELEQKREAVVSQIQRAWFRYRIRKLVRHREVKRGILYGMLEPRRLFDTRHEDEQNARRINRKRKQIFDANFVSVCEDEEARILKLHSPWIMEDISDHIRNWFREFYDGVHEFDRYPEAMEGGTILVVRGDTKTIPEYEEHLKKLKENRAKTGEQKNKEKELRKKQKEKEKIERQKVKELAKKRAREKKMLEQKEGKTWDFSEPEFITNNFINLEKTFEEYERDWACINEAANPKQLPYMHWIQLDKYSEAHRELRLIVDEFMRMEHELLRMALAKDNRKKYKRQKKSKKKRGAKKKGKKKTKIPMDLTGDRTTESLFEELREMGVVYEFEQTSLDDYMGDFNLNAFELRNSMKKNPLHFMGELKNIIRTVQLGMGPLDLPKVKSLLIIGQAESGKRFLMKGIATEIGAVVLDISAPIVHKFPDLKYFQHIIMKMARILQPTVIFIHEVHKAFYKKVPLQEKHLQPQRLGKVLAKAFVKRIQKNDKIMVIGTTSEPWKAKLAKLKKAFEKVVFVPPPDYSTTHTVWRKECLKRVGVPRDFECSALACVTRGYAIGQIIKHAQAVLNTRRILSLARKPLHPREFLDSLLADRLPPTSAELEKFTKIYNRLDRLAKKRMKFMAALELKAKKH